MKVTSSKIEDRTAYLTVEVDKKEVDEYLDKAYQRVVSNIDVPGFRKGHAPREVVEKHFGADKMFDEAKQELMPQVCKFAADDQKLQPLDQPMAKITQRDPLIAEVILPLQPTIEIGDYKTIRMQPEEAKVTDKDVDDFIYKLRRQNANYTPTDGPVKDGDVVVANMTGYVMESPIIQKPNVQFKVSTEAPSDIPGLVENFIGMQKDEEKEFSFTLPDDYPNKLVAGKKATFHVQVTGIKAEELPEMNDELLKTIAPDVASKDDFRQQIEQNLQIEKEQQVQYDFEEKLVAHLIDMSQIEIAPMMIESEANRLIQDALQQVASTCKSQEEYDARIKQIPMDKVRDEYHTIAERRIKWNLALGEIAKAEKIDAGNEEIEAEIERMLQGVSSDDREKQRQQLNQPQYRFSIKSILQARKAIQALSDIATGKKAANAEDDTEDKADQAQKEEK
jgi:trigger factor